MTKSGKQFVCMFFYFGWVVVIYRIDTHKEEGERHMWATPLMRKKHAEHSFHTAITNLISCRLREGYTIKDVNIIKSKAQI